MAKNVTMRDIAKKVGVSTVTVSKALTDKDGVGSELRAVIKATAEEMGYTYDGESETASAVDAAIISVLLLRNTMWIIQLQSFRFI